MKYYLFILKNTNIGYDKTPDYKTVVKMVYVELM